MAWSMTCSMIGRLPTIPAFEGVRVIGHQWSPHSSEIRDFLGRNFVPHQWLNVETDEAAKQLLTTTGADASSLPLVVFPDGSFLSNPPTAEVARKLGLKTKAEFPFYDLVVVGAGPAGLAAAVYGAADGLHTLLIEREAPGGQAGRSSRIENYLGFPMGLSGNDLARRAVAQARRFGVEILDAPGSQGRSDRRSEPRADAVGWSGDRLPRAAHCHRHRLPKTGRARAGPTERRRGLLLCADVRSLFLPRRRYLHRRRGKLRGPGRHVFFQICPPGDDAGARRFFVRHDVAIPGKPDRRDEEYRSAD